MKTIIFIAILLVSFTTVFSQSISVPDRITDKFLKLYPNVSKSLWNKEGNNFEVNFKKNGNEKSVLFSPEGEIIGTENPSKLAKLPYGIDKFISDMYPGYKISESSKIEKSDGEIYFETEITNGNAHKDLLFDTNGKLKKVNFDKNYNSSIGS